ASFPPTAHSMHSPVEPAPAFAAPAGRMPSAHDPDPARRSSRDRGSEIDTDGHLESRLGTAGGSTLPSDEQLHSRARSGGWPLPGEQTRTALGIVPSQRAENHRQSGTARDSVQRFANAARRFSVVGCRAARASKPAPSWAKRRFPTSGTAPRQL